MVLGQEHCKGKNAAVRLHPEILGGGAKTSLTGYKSLRGKSVKVGFNKIKNLRANRHTRDQERSLTTYTFIKELV